MKLDSEQDREILIHLVSEAPVQVKDAPVFFDLLQRLREAPIEEGEVEDGEIEGPVIANISDLSKVH